MKLFLHMLLLFAGSLFSLAGVSTEAVMELRDADRQVKARIEAAKFRAAELKAETLAEPATQESIVDLGDRKLILRKIAPLPIPKAPKVLKTDESQIGFSAEFLRQLEAAQTLEPVQLRLSAMVYGGDYTELTLSIEDDQYRVWVNLDYNCLPFLGDFTTDTRSYTYTGSNNRIDRQQEREKAAAASERGFKYRSQRKAPPVQFNSRQPEYILVTEDDRAVPPEVYRQLDDLMRHYLERFDSLKLAHDNALKVQAAQQRYDAAHPAEAPQDIILNYSRVSERAC